MLGGGGLKVVITGMALGGVYEVTNVLILLELLLESGGVILKVAVVIGLPGHEGAVQGLWMLVVEEEWLAGSDLVTCQCCCCGCCRAWTDTAWRRLFLRIEQPWRLGCIPSAI